MSFCLEDIIGVLNNTLKTQPEKPAEYQAPSFP
jgi:hypothetical protein